jgi:Fe-S cluster biosynthesis and repair protein YggX
MDLNQRIEQFEQLTREEPTEALHWFSLAGAYAQAERHQDAATAFERSIAINHTLSRGYQLAAEQYIALDKKPEALRLLNDGHRIAAENGDLKVKSAIEDLFAQLGEEPPADETMDPDDAPEGTFVCRRTRRPGHQLPRPPFKGPVGQWIYDNIAQETWNDWIAQGTKVINELRLDLSRDEDAETYDKHMRDYLGIDDELHAELTGEKSTA